MQLLIGSGRWVSPAQTLALVVTLVLSLELGFPIGSQAQTSQPQTSTSMTDIKNQDLPPMQEVENIQERKPFYKKWWFWGLVVAAVAGGAGAIAIASGGGGGGSASTGGNVTVNGPAPQ
ncbi:MAG: hypothetical protein U0236_02450 [Nitrospira sp.]